MPNLLNNIVVYLVSFLVIWFGSGLIVTSVTKLSHRFHMSSFFMSFVVLGMLTSMTEVAVGLSAISSNNPGIFVGNLLGGIPIIFLFIVPILAIFGGGVKINHGLTPKSLLFPLLLSLSPYFVVLDKKVSNLEGGVLVILYSIVVYIFQKQNNFANGVGSKILHLKKYSFFDMLKVLVGVGLVLFSSNILVEKTIYFSEVFNIAPFYISLIFLSFGTNLPELTLAIRSIFMGTKDIAFGDYLGSASANAFLFGIFTLMSKDAVLHVNNFFGTFILVAVGIFLFYFFSRSGRTITPKEGWILLLVYFCFIVAEFM